MTGRGALLRRIVREHRAAVIPLAIVLLANVLVYAFWVYPLERRVSTVTERTRKAEAELASARALHEEAAATLTGRSRAAEDLERFYSEVLPADLPAARRLAYSRVTQLPRQVNLETVGTTFGDPDSDPDRTLTRLPVRTTVEGSYQAIRRLIHQLEQASEFLVIDRMRLAEDANEEGLLSVQLELSTYFREPEP